MRQSVALDLLGVHEATFYVMSLLNLQHRDPAQRDFLLDTLSRGLRAFLDSEIK